MSTPHRIQESRAAIFTVIGLGAIVAVGVWILRSGVGDYLTAPPERPHTAGANREHYYGPNTPALAVTPSERASIGVGCRVSDVALVQSHRGPFQQTTLQSLMAWEARARRRSPRMEVVGWSARTPDEGTADAGDVGCLVAFTVRDGRRQRQGLWRVSGDRTEVTPANDLAREITSIVPTAGR